MKDELKAGRWQRIPDGSIPELHGFGFTLSAEFTYRKENVTSEIRKKKQNCEIFFGQFSSGRPVRRGLRFHNEGTNIEDHERESITIINVDHKKKLVDYTVVSYLNCWYNVIIRSCTYIPKEICSFRSPGLFLKQTVVVA